MKCWALEEPDNYSSDCIEEYAISAAAMTLLMTTLLMITTYNVRPRLIVSLILRRVWEPHGHFLVFEAWFTNAQSCLLGAMNIYQTRL